MVDHEPVKSKEHWLHDSNGNHKRLTEHEPSRLIMISAQIFVAQGIVDPNSLNWHHFDIRPCSAHNF